MKGRIVGIVGGGSLGKDVTLTVVVDLDTEVGYCSNPREHLDKLAKALENLHIGDVEIKYADGD